MGKARAEAGAWPPGGAAPGGRPDDAGASAGEEWPPATVEGLARALHGHALSEAAAAGHEGRAWEALTDAARARLAARAGRAVRDGDFVPGQGWADERRDGPAPWTGGTEAC